MVEENKCMELKYYKRKKVKISEDYCFVCKDGGFLLECERKDCWKSYHPECVGKDESFAKLGSSWTCGRHSCFICKKLSRLECFCCPTSVCQACMNIAEFVQVKKLKGFCNNCLKLATLIEQNVDVDSDGDKVDFEDTETIEFLFKDYWRIVKEQEAITSEDLCKAGALLKRGEHWINGSDSDGLPKEDVTYVSEKMENDCNVEALSFTKTKRQNATIKGLRFKKRNFIGWGSEELIGFLSSIGRDTKEPLTQLDVSEVIKGHIQKNNLLHPGKKKKVECDDKLYSLFRKKSLKFNKIYNLLESHFVANEDFTDDSDSGLEEYDSPKEGKRMRKTSSDAHKSMLRNSKAKVIKPSRSSYAAIVDKNIKLVYLKKSLIQDFLKNTQTFESKMLGSFVRIKLNPTDYHYSIYKTHLLRQVTGIKKATAVYKLGEMSTDIVLRVSNMWNDIHISMLSDDDFEEEECEELRLLVRNGHLKRLTIAELEDKARNLHVDIVKHWLNKEIVALQRKIDRANEKGWYNQKIECIDQRELLRKPDEQTRLLSEIPEVIPDTAVELEGSPSIPELASQSGNEGIGAPSNEKIAERKCEGTAAALNVSGRLMTGIGAPFNEKVAVGESEGNAAASNSSGRLMTVGYLGQPALLCCSLSQDNKLLTSELCDLAGKGSPSIEKIAEREFEGTAAASNGSGCLMTENGAAFNEKNAEKTDEVDPACFKKDAERKSDGIGASAQEITAEMRNEEGGQFMPTLIEIPDDEDDSGDKVTSGIEIIDLDDEEGFAPATGSANLTPNLGPDAFEESRKLWHYMDPHGKVQGPFSMADLIRWSDGGFFDVDFRVWKVGQSQRESILLTLAMQQR